ncbi:hypothetical protein INT48_005957, partial [Thamnidium elegans]
MLAIVSLLVEWPTKPAKYRRTVDKKPFIDKVGCIQLESSSEDINCNFSFSATDNGIILGWPLTAKKKPGKSEKGDNVGQIATQIERNLSEINFSKSITMRETERAYMVQI